MKILMSIHEEFIEKIKSGDKKFEFRKVEAKQFDLESGEILVYATSPISKVVGIAKISKVLIDTPEKIWKHTKKFSGVDKEFYYSYYENKDKAVAYEIASYTEFETPKDLAEFGVAYAPQSFIYLK